LKQTLIEAKEQELAAAGLTILGEKPATVGSYGSTPAEPFALIEYRGYIDKPVYSDVKATKTIRAKDHTTCPGRAMFVDAHQSWKGAERVWEVDVLEYCTDWAANGHYRPAGKGSAKKDPEAMTDAEKKQAEADRAERKRVIQNNKDWPLATEVRRTWIKDTLLQLKKLPADAELIPALWMSSNLPMPNPRADEKTAANWLGIADATGRAFRQHLLDANDHGIRRANLAIALAGVEAVLTEKDSWRFKAQFGLGLYLRVLASWGYDPSVLELELIAEAKKAKQ
jgi:ParB family chromosome partitioning protein